MIEVLLTIALFIMVFSLAMFMLTKDKDTPKTKERKFYFNKRLSRSLIKYPIVEKLDKFMKEAGNPFNIELDDYILYTVIIITVSFVLGLRSGWLQGIKVFLVTEAVLNILLYYKLKERRRRIMIELCNIQDIFYFQSKIDTPMDVILAYASKIVSEPLKTPLNEFSSKKAMKRDLGDVLEEFRKTTDLMEFQAFTFILEQREKTGFSSDNHQAQSTMLKRQKRMKRRIEREYKRVKLMFASFLLFGCYILFVTVPIVKSVLQTINLMFR